MNTVSLQELRRVADSLSILRGKHVANAIMRSDLRQLRIELEDGLLAVVSVDLDETGHPRLELDVIRQPSAPAPQLEVRFETA